MQIAIMSPTSKLESKHGITRSSTPARKEDNENPNPQGSIIMVLVFVAVIAAIGGIVFTYFKKRKSKSNKKEIEQNVNE